LKFLHWSFGDHVAYVDLKYLTANNVVTYSEDVRDKTWLLGDNYPDRSASTILAASERFEV
jgi:hypothetical protein